MPQNIDPFLKSVPISVLGLILIAAVLGFVFIPLFWRHDKDAAREKARTFSGKRWYVKSVSAGERGSYLLIYSAEKDRAKASLYFRPSHPSVALIRDLKHLDIVEFEFIEEPMERAPETELCAYLKLKRICSFS